MMKKKQITFLNAINRLIRRLFSFTGRASRSEYWLGYLGLLIISTSLQIIISISYLFLISFFILIGLGGGDGLPVGANPLNYIYTTFVCCYCGYLYANRNFCIDCSPSFRYKKITRYWVKWLVVYFILPAIWVACTFHIVSTSIKTR